MHWYSNFHIWDIFALICIMRFPTWDITFNVHEKYIYIFFIIRYFHVIQLSNSIFASREIWVIQHRHSLHDRPHDRIHTGLSRYALTVNTRRALCSAIAGGDVMRSRMQACLFFVCVFIKHRFYDIVVENQFDISQTWKEKRGVYFHCRISLWSLVTQQHHSEYRMYFYNSIYINSILY